MRFSHKTIHRSPLYILIRVFEAFLQVVLASMSSQKHIPDCVPIHSYNTVKQLYENVKLRKVIKNFFKGLALFGYREPFVMGAPLSVVWNITKNCNLKCSHCFEDSHYQQKSNGDLSTTEAKKVIRILAANDVITLNFSGGEPLVRKDLEVYAPQT